MGRFANFRNPIGLVGRILRDRNPAGIEALLRTGAEAPISLLDRMLAANEAELLAAAAPSRHPAVLIVGAPRSGTTLVHQLLVNHTYSSYFTNRNSMFHRSPLAASVRFDRFPGSTRLASYYGLSAGNDAPNDAFHIWNRWLGEDRYRPVPPTDPRDLARFFDAWRTAHDLPLVSKNNRNTAAMTGLAAAIDGAVFVIVRRDPVYVAQSLLEARERIQGSDRVGWGLSARSGGDPLDDVISQVEEVDSVIDEQRPPGSVDVQYEQLVDRPDLVVKSIAEQTGLTVRRLDEIGWVEDGNIDRLPAVTMDRLRARLSAG